MAADVIGNIPGCQARSGKFPNSVFGPCSGRFPKMTLADRIRSRLAELDLTPAAAARESGLKPDYLRDVLRGVKKSISGESAIPLAKTLRCSVSWLLTDEPDHIPSEEVAAGLPGSELHDSYGFSTEAPFKGDIPGSTPEIDARAGAGLGVVGEHEIIKVREGESVVGHRVVSEWLFPGPYLRHELRSNPAKTVVLEVIGDSMSPSLESGDRVLVDTSYQRPNPDGIYVIDDGDGPMVKRVQLVRPSSPEQIKIISDNKNQETYTRLLSDIRIVGRVAGRLTSM